MTNFYTNLLNLAYSLPKILCQMLHFTLYKTKLDFNNILY